LCDLLCRARIGLFHGTTRGVLANVAHRQEQKRPTWRNTRRYSATSAYSLTSPPARPGCSLSSHPTISLDSRDQVRRDSSTSIILSR
jgi:hypothetical protein